MSLSRGAAVARDRVGDGFGAAELLASTIFLPFEKLNAVFLGIIVFALTADTLR